MSSFFSFFVVVVVDSIHFTEIHCNSILRRSIHYVHFIFRILKLIAHNYILSSGVHANVHCRSVLPHSAVCCILVDLIYIVPFDRTFFVFSLSHTQMTKFNLVFVVFGFGRIIFSLKVLRRAISNIVLVVGVCVCMCVCLMFQFFHFSIIFFFFFSNID